MAVNMDLIARTLGKIITTPEEWKQSTWRCGSGMCFAGHAAALAGYSFVAPARSDYAEYVEDPTGTVFYDKEKDAVVADGEEQIKKSMATLKEYDDVDMDYSYWMLVDLADAAKLAVRQRTNPDQFIRVSSCEIVAQREMNLSDLMYERIVAGSNTLDRIISLVGQIRAQESEDAVGASS